MDATPEIVIHSVKDLLPKKQGLGKRDGKIFKELEIERRRSRKGKGGQSPGSGTFKATTCASSAPEGVDEANDDARPALIVDFPGPVRGSYIINLCRNPSKIL